MRDSELRGSRAGFAGAPSPPRSGFRARARHPAEAESLGASGVVEASRFTRLKPRLDSSPGKRVRLFWALSNGFRARARHPAEAESLGATSGESETRGARVLVRQSPEQARPGESRGSPASGRRIIRGRRGESVHPAQASAGSWRPSPRSTKPRTTGRVSPGMSPAEA
jgi:hypothetical protein